VSVDLALVVVGATTLALGLLSSTLKRLWLSVPLVAVALGVLLGPEVLHVVEAGALSAEHRVLEELARITLSVSLISTGLQFTRDDLRVTRVRGSLLLTVGMVGMWLLTSAGAWLLLDVPAWVALLIGAILTPTDPVVAGTLVTGALAQENLPRWLRRTLQLESGANDGLALAFVLLPLLVLVLPADPVGAVAGEVAKQLGIAIGVGLATGWVAAKLLDAAEEHEGVGESFFVTIALSLGLLTLGAAHLLGGSGVLASFIAGVTFSLAVGERYAEQLEGMQSGFERALIVPVFVLFGALLPWHAWATLGVGGLAFAAWALVVRRPLAAAVALAPTDTPARGRAFLAWYGPLGVAALYYVLFVERYGLAEQERIFAASTLAIAASVLVHSVSATPGVRRYAGRPAATPLRHPLTPGVDRAP
jgi:NhaP-type Na+/H+ or K+/H+ antiporter